MYLDDEYFMRQALIEAQKAYDKGEIPVGAVLVAHQTILARTHNLTERLNDVTAHAEVLAITAGSQQLGSKYLKDTTLYVTLEPCPMCAAALAWAQLGRLVYGASDKKRGCTCFQPSLLHPKTAITKGILAKEAEDLMRSFFKIRRK